MTTFRILHIDLSQQQHAVYELENHDYLIGGSSLAQFLHQEYFHPHQSWDAPEQPIIFAVGPLTGIFPLMSKMVCAFNSPNNSYTESYAGGRAGLALKFTSFDAVVLTGKANKLSCLEMSNGDPEFKDMTFAKGLEPHASISFARKICPKGSGQRTIMSIGSSGEQGSPLASINVDTHRHFGRMGGGALLGTKNIKALIIHGNQDLQAPSNQQYKQLYQEIFTKALHSKRKPQAAPRNSSLAGLVAKGELHGGACACCPIGCVHPGFIRKKLERYQQNEMTLGDEPIFWLGKILQIKGNFDILRLLEANERYCFDVLAVATALYWATMATEEGYISVTETIYPLQFGNAKAYQQAISALAKGANPFYRDLAKGSFYGGQIYGCKEQACPLGEEKIFLSSRIFARTKQDFFWTAQDVEEIVQKAIVKQRDKERLNSMIACLFGKTFYQGEVLESCLRAAGYSQSFIRTIEQYQKNSWLNGGLKTLVLSQKFYTTLLPRAVSPQEFLVALQQEYDSQMHALYPGTKE